MYPTSQPPVPYGPENANQDLSQLVEYGFKQVRGDLTEGRYLTFEMNGYALTNSGRGTTHVSSSKVTDRHDSKSQRWVIHQVGDQTGNSFIISSAVDGQYIAYLQGLTPSADLAQTYSISDLGNGQGYTLQTGSLFLEIDSDGLVLDTTGGQGFSIFSVTYHS
jgi:phospholipase C